MDRLRLYANRCFYGDVYLAGYLRVLDDEVRTDTLMFFNSRKIHNFFVIRQLAKHELVPARAWQQQSKSCSS